MPRVVEADPKVLSSLQKQNGKDGFLYGIILGQRTSKSDYVFMLAPSPIITGNNNGTYSSEGFTSQPNNRLIEKVDKKEVWLQANEANNMMCGGLNALGMFVVTPDNIFAPNNINKLKPFFNSPNILEKRENFDLVLHFCPETQKFACRSIERDGNVFDVSWRFSKKPLSWMQLDSGFYGDVIPFSIYKNNDGSTTASQIKDGCRLFSETLDRCEFRINGICKKKSDPISSFRTSKEETEKSDKKKENCDQLTVQVYFKCPTEWKEEEDSETEEEPVDEVGYRGVLKSLSFLHESTTVGEAIEAIRCDLKKTFRYRVDMYTTCVGSGIELSKNKVAHCLPRRALYQLQWCPIAITDYLDFEEGPTTVLENLQEHLGINGNICHVDTNFEPEFCPEVEKMEEDKRAERRGTGTKHQKTGATPVIIMGMIISFVILSLGIIIQYLLRSA